MFSGTEICVWPVAACSLSTPAGVSGSAATQGDADVSNEGTARKLLADKSSC